MEELLSYIGKKIKFYRKMKKMNLEELARAINKSKATISKYESGDITIDIATLFEVAEALEVDISRLIDFPKETKKYETMQHLFEEVRFLHVYHSFEKKIFYSGIQLGTEREEGTVDATLYYMVKEDSLEKSQCIYHGSMRYHNNILQFLFQNYYNDVETVLINFFVPMGKVERLSGIMSGLRANSLQPTSMKVVLSKEKLEPEEQKPLLLFTKEEQKKIKEDNIVLIDTIE